MSNDKGFNTLPRLRIIVLVWFQFEERIGSGAGVISDAHEGTSVGGSVGEGVVGKQESIVLLIQEMQDRSYP